MRTWELQPPLTRPGAGFGQIEVPQVRVIDGQPLLVFSCHPEEQSAARQARFGHFCTWSVPGESVAGPWDVAAARPFEGEPSLFAAPLVRHREGGWALFGFLNTEPEGHVAFELLDPIPVELRDGALVHRGSA
jgi:beta-fructofuranosidase